MPYSAPTLLILRQSVSRDLRDSANASFSTAEVDDLIDLGFVEVNRVYPLQQIETVDVTLDVDSNVVRSYTIESREVSRIEVWRDGRFYRTVPQFVDEPNSGWDVWGSTLVIPNWLELDDTQDSLQVYGYQDREMLVLDGDVAETDAEAELGIRLFATMTGYQRLQNDRALFQQWLAVPGNNDISPTQLTSMANTYLAQWERHRNQMRRLRR